MKLVLSLIACAAISGAAYTQTLKTPAPSPSQTIKQDFALSSVEISYSRPAVKGRKIFGDLVPYGKVWRTGANAATTITFGDEVMIGGTKIAAGKYGLLTIPGQKEWTIIISKQTDVTNPANYRISEDLVRINAKTDKLPASMESFIIQFGKVSATAIDIALMWDKTMVTLPVTADIDTRIMADIDKAIGGDKPPYVSAAMYYIENGKDLNKAIGWLDNAIKEEPKAYWAYYQKANALAKSGKKTEAVEAAKKASELAKEGSNADYVALSEKLIATLK